MLRGTDITSPNLWSLDYRYMKSCMYICHGSEAKSWCWRDGVVAKSSTYPCVTPFLLAPQETEKDAEEAGGCKRNNFHWPLVIYLLMLMLVKHTASFNKMSTGTGRQVQMMDPNLTETKSPSTDNLGTRPRLECVLRWKAWALSSARSSVWSKAQPCR